MWRTDSNWLMEYFGPNLPNPRRSPPSPPPTIQASTKVTIILLLGSTAVPFYRCGLCVDERDRFT